MGWWDDFYEDWCGTLWLLATSLALIALASVAPQTRQDGVPPLPGWSDSPAVWASPRALAGAGAEELRKEQLADLHWWFRLLMNRPWFRKDTFQKVAAAQPGKHLSHSEWLGGRPFPSGKLHVEHTISLVLGYWRFVYREVPEDTRWCLFLCVLNGLIESAKVALAATITRVITEPLESDRAFDKEGARRHLILLLGAALALHVLSGSVDWSFNGNVPAAGYVRNLCFRMQRKFEALSGDSAEAWPPSRCESMLAYTVYKAHEVYMSMFTLVQGLSTVLACVIVTVCVNPAYLDFTAGMSAQTNFLPFFLVLAVTEAVDFYLRRANLQDLARREHEVRTATLVVSSRRMVEMRDEASCSPGRGEDGHGEDGWHLSSSRCEDMFVLRWRRAFHLSQYSVVCQKASDGVQHVAEAVLLYRAGMLVFSGAWPISRFAALTKALQILSHAQSALRKAVSTWYQDEPALRAVCEVMNMGEDFDGDGEESGENSSLGESGMD